MKTESSKSTILVIVTGFIALHLAFSWQWPVIVSLFIGVIGIVSSRLRNKIEWAWMKLSELLGYFIPNIILTIVFFCILTPLSFLFRLFNKDVLMLSNVYNSYFIDVEQEIHNESFEKPW